MEDGARVLGGGGDFQHVGADDLAELRRHPIVGRGVVVAEDAGAGGRQRQLQPLGVGVGLVAGLGQVGDVLAEAVHLIAAGLELAAAAVEHTQVPPAAVGRSVAHIGLGGAFLARQAFADGGVDGAVVLVLNHLQQTQRRRIAALDMAERELGREMVDLGVGVIAPGADFGGVHQPVAGGVVGLHALQHAALAADVDQHGQDGVAVLLQVEPHPAGPIGALELEGLDAVAGRGVGGGGT